METAQHEVLSTRDARKNLSKMLRLFRERGLAAQDFVIGSRRRPEAVVISYDRYLELVDPRADQEMRAVSEARLASPASVVVDLDEIAVDVGVDPERTRI
jgi:PHD/YefM family antitoxin component YafN of YafNO toxin-antitoxin module